MKAILLAWLADSYIVVSDAIYVTKACGLHGSAYTRQKHGARSASAPFRQGYWTFHGQLSLGRDCLGREVSNKELGHTSRSYFFTSDDRDAKMEVITLRNLSTSAFM